MSQIRSRLVNLCSNKTKPRFPTDPQNEAQKWKVSVRTVIMINDTYLLNTNACPKILSMDGKCHCNLCLSAIQANVLQTKSCREKRQCVSDTCSSLSRDLMNCVKKLSKRNENSTKIIFTSNSHVSLFRIRLSRNNNKSNIS